MRRRVLLLGALWFAILPAFEGALRAQATTRNARKPQVWAIVVGIDDYNDPLIPDSRTDTRDAASIRNWFLALGGLGRDHVLYCSDLGTRQPGAVDSPRPNIFPSADNLDWAFQKWLPNRARSGDLVVFYYAGRVASLGSTPNIPRTDFVLLPPDALNNNPAATGWSLERALDRFVLDTSGKCQIVCWLATTVGGNPTGLKPVVPAASARPGLSKPIGRNWLNRLARWPGVTTWLASDRPLENVIRDEPSTLFTAKLLAGLGKPERKLNLAACLQSLQKSPELKRQGFETMGAVPPRLTLWAELYGVPAIQPRPEVVLQVGHADRLTGIVVSADGERVITSSLDSTLRVWSLKDKALLRVLTGHEVGATALSLSADGRWLVSGGGRPASGLLIHDLNKDFLRLVPEQPHDQRVEQIAMLPDGNHFVSIDLAAQSFLWDLDTAPPEPRPWLDEAGKVKCLAVASGGDAETGKVAAICGDKTLRIYHASGTGKGLVTQYPDQPTALAIDPKGQWLSVGFANGRIALRDLATGADSERRLPGPIAQLALSAEGKLAVSHAQGLTLLQLGSVEPAAERVLSLKPSGRFVFSSDGLFLAAYGLHEGGLEVWQLEGLEPKKILSDDQAEVSQLAFTGDGRSLVTGTLKGAVKTWSLNNLKDDVSWSISANRSRIQRLSASPSRQFLLILNDLGQAQVWDLKERTCRRLPGSWSSGVFPANDDVLVLTEAAREGHPGRLVKVRLEGLRAELDPSFFQTKADGFQIPEGSAFLSLTLSPDGSRLAATTDPSLVPLVCVWETKTGRLTHWLTPNKLGDAARSLSFTSDAKHLLTAGDSPQARLWNLSAALGEPAAPSVIFAGNDDDRNISVAEVRPGDGHQVATGHRNGLVRLWTWREGQAEPLGPPADVVVPGVLSGAVKALAFPVEGKNQYLAASGDNTSFWLGLMSNARPTRVNDQMLRPHHYEQINALIAWPTIAVANDAMPATLVSGSDDTTVKLWNLKNGSLQLSGTFISAGGGESINPEADPGAAADADWVVFTPDGHFDASAKGRQLLRFRNGDQARLMDQFDETKLYSFDLGETLLASKPHQTVPALEAPAPISIELPNQVDPSKPETEVTILLGGRGQKDVRLYHNDSPIGADLETEALASPGATNQPGRIKVPVKLVKGSNRFYAMATTASQEGSFDSRSTAIELSYLGETDPGRLHVLALGVGDYNRRRLKFAEHDAERISEILHERGIDSTGKEKGLRIVRTNADVSTEDVNKAFRQLNKAVKGRPQDTVVVFLAGHTGVFENSQFCLLLPSYPFPKEAPVLAQARDGVVTRDGLGGKSLPGDVMPYSVIEANLMRLDALNRLVIIDACQAEAISEDEQVKQIRRWMEVKSRRARNSYLMAARRGEPALEIEGLHHGLFTYTLLRGLGGQAVDRDQDPVEITQLALRDDADFNGDGLVSTAELDDYAKRALPAIARLFPVLMTRSRDEEAKVRRDLPPLDPQTLQQNLRMQSASDSFPLVPLAPRK